MEDEEVAVEDEVVVLLLEVEEDEVLVDADVVVELASYKVYN